MNVITPINFTVGLRLVNRDTGYGYVVSGMDSRVVVISNDDGRWVESITHLVASIKYRVA